MIQETEKKKTKIMILNKFEFKVKYFLFKLMNRCSKCEFSNYKYNCFVAVGRCCKKRKNRRIKNGKRNNI